MTTQEVEKCPRCQSEAVKAERNGWLRFECGNPNCGIGPKWELISETTPKTRIEQWNYFAKGWMPQGDTDQAIANEQRDRVLRSLVTDAGNTSGPMKPEASHRLCVGDLVEFDVIGGTIQSRVLVVGDNNLCSFLVAGQAFHVPVSSLRRPK